VKLVEPPGFAQELGARQTGGKGRAVEVAEESIGGVTTASTTAAGVAETAVTAAGRVWIRVLGGTGATRLPDSHAGALAADKAPKPRKTVVKEQELPGRAPGQPASDRGDVVRAEGVHRVRRDERVL
jgi:hypothetical protein